MASYKRKSSKTRGKKASSKRSLSRKRSSSKKRSPSRRPSAPHHKFSVMAYFYPPQGLRGEELYEWSPTVKSTKDVKIVRQQRGTDDGETFYFDAIVSAKNPEAVALWLNKQKNFASSDNISRID